MVEQRFNKQGSSGTYRFLKMGNTKNTTNHKAHNVRPALCDL